MTRLTDEQLDAAFAEACKRWKNVITTGEVSRVSAPFYFTIFEAGWRCAIDAIEAELSKQEPVAWALGDARYCHSSNIIAAHEFTPDAEYRDEWVPLYTAPLPAAKQEPVAHGELHPDRARSVARTALGYAQAFDGKGIDWHSDEPWPHRIELAQALDWITDLGAMVLNLADRVPTPLPSAPDTVQMPLWIPRDEELPPPRQDFIALNRDGRIFRSRMCYGMHEPWFTYPRGDKDPSDTMPAWLDVTHWMPLPKSAP